MGVPLRYATCRAIILKHDRFVVLRATAIPHSDEHTSSINDLGFLESIDRLFNINTENDDIDSMLYYKIFDT